MDEGATSLGLAPGARLAASARPPRPSAILRRLAASSEPVPLSRFGEAFGDGGFALVMLVFGLMTIAAIPPGSTLFTGVPIVAVAAQLVAGRERLWLPPRLGARTIAPASIARVNEKLLRHLRRVERMLRPRPPGLFGPLGRRLIGLACLLLGVLIVFPVPFGNLLPGIAVAVLSLSLFRQDGLAALAGFAIGIASVVALFVIYGGLIAALITWL